jgi:hypothetical protein
MGIFVLTATYELRVSRKSHLRDHPSWESPNSDEGHTLWYSLYVRTLCQESIPAWRAGKTTLFFVPARQAT